MTIDSRIPLQAQVPNYFGTLVGADQARFDRKDREHQNALRAFLGEYGQAIYAGDQGALGQYAQFDPQAALGIRSQYQQMQHADERLRLARAAGARAAANAQSNAEQQAEAAKEFALLRNVAMARENGPEAFQQALATSGLASAGVTGENFDLYLATAQGAEAVFKGVQATRPEPQGPQSSLGKIQADIDAGLLPEGTPLRASQPSETIYDSSGNVIVQRGEAPPKLTVEAGKNTGYYLRSQDAHQILNGLEGEGLDFFQQNAEAVPLGLGNYMRSPDFQKFDQARRDFVNAVLRRESGAVISDSEFDNANKQYFPQPGDSQEVIKQKRQNRVNAIEGMRIGSGEGAGFVDRTRAERQAGEAQTFEQFAADPAVKAAAAKYGVSVEEMWEVKQGAQ